VEKSTSKAKRSRSRMNGRSFFTLGMIVRKGKGKIGMPRRTEKKPSKSKRSIGGGRGGKRADEVGGREMRPRLHGVGIRGGGSHA